jgi:hypothetical protein
MLSGWPRSRFETWVRVSPALVGADENECWLALSCQIGSGGCSSAAGERTVHARREKSSLVLFIAEGKIENLSRRPDGGQAVAGVDGEDPKLGAAGRRDQIGKL